MIKQFKYILFIFFVGISMISQAQRDTSLTREVEVTKAFKPTISDANKINEMPTIDETGHQPPKFNYGIDSRPIFNTFSVTPLKAATIKNTQKKGTGYGLVKAGVGNYSKPCAEFFFNDVVSRKAVFGIHAKHLSSHGKIELEGEDKVDAPFSNSEAEFYFKQSFSKSVLALNFDLNHNGFNYYGYPVKPIPEILLKENQEVNYLGTKQAFTKGGISVSLNDPTVELDDPVFNFNFNYHYFKTKTDQTEHFGEFKADFQKPFETGTLIGDAGVVYVQSDEIFNQELSAVGKKTQTWIYAKPTYYLGGKLANIQAGLNAWFIMDNDMDAQAKIAPNIRVNLIPVKDMFKIYAGIDGDYVNNYYSKIAYENPFVDPMHDVKNSFEKFRFYGGIEGKFSTKTNFKIAADYSYIDDQPLYFMNEYYYPDPASSPDPLVINNTFDVLYDNIKLLKINMEIFHTSSEKFDLLLSGNYYAYTLDEQTVAWNMPEWDANISLNYNITDQLSIGSDIYLIGMRKTLIIEHENFFIDVLSSATNQQTFKSYNLDTTFDLNVNAKYRVTQKFAVFGQLNNFGFQKYQRWFGYPVQSFNALAGISYAF